MTDRGLPSADASPACPFVAFEDDRDERADRPDHRHRCYAEADPAPRALAHQEAYCLSSAFPVCPVFQEWARRESARARAADETAAEPPPSASVSPGSSADEWSERPRPVGMGDDDAEPIESRPHRNPPRDWAAPPPWASGAGGVGAMGGGAAGAGPSRSGSAAASGPPAFLDDGTPREARGLAGSAADRLAGGRPADVPSTAPDPDLASLVAGSAAVHRAGTPTPDERLAAERAAARTAEDAVYARQTGDFPSPTRTGRRPAVSSTRGPAPERDRPRAPQREHVQSHEGPSWERARRNEAYPQIKSRVGMPPIPRVVVLALALAVAAVGLFFLPALIGVGGGDADPSPTPSASVAPATATPDPTPTPAPTPQTYTIAQGDTLSKIAKEFGLTLEQLLEANTDTIQDPDLISVGDVINIPIPPPDEVGGSASAEPSVAP